MMKIKSVKWVSLLLFAALFVIAGCGNNNTGNTAAGAVILPENQRIRPRLPRSRNAASCWSV